MVGPPVRNPIRGGPTYKPGESLLGTVGRVVSQDLPALAGRISQAWKSGARPATAGPPATQPAPAAAPQTTQPTPAPSSGVPTPGLPPGYQGVAGRHSGPSPDLLKAREAIAGIESRGSGDFGAKGPINKKTGYRAFGRYQVNEPNVGPWTAKQTGSPSTPEKFLKDPALQNKVFNTEFGQKAKEYGSKGTPDYEAASKWWLTGKSPSQITGKEKDPLGTDAAEYAGKFLTAFTKPKPKPTTAVAGFGEEKLDEFKSPWAGIDKAAADTARWRKNREEGKQAVTDAKTERKPSWIKGVVKDYISAKYGVRKEEKLDEIYPPMWAGYPAHMEKLRKEHEAKKKADKEKKESEKKDVKESKTQTSPGVESEEHPKKFELPEKYEGAYSVRKIYVDEGSGSFYGGGGAGGYNVASSPARQTPRPAARPVARPQAAAAPVAKPAAAPAPAATPTPTPATTPSAAPAQPTAPAPSATPEPAIKSSAPGPQKGTTYTTPTVNPNASPAFKSPDVNAPGSTNIEPGGGSRLSPKGLFARAQVLPTTPSAAPQAAAPAPTPTPSLTAQGGTPTPKLDEPVTAQGGATAPPNGGAMQQLAGGKIQGLLKKLPIGNILGKLGQ